MDSTTLCNLALQQMGARSTIASLNEQSTEAKACNLLLPSLIDDVLSQSDWNFARRTVALGLLKSRPSNVSGPWQTGWPTPPWGFQYAYPADCIQMQSVIGQGEVGAQAIIPIFGDATIYAISPGNAAKYKVSTDLDDSGNNITVLLTNAAQALGVYTSRVTNPNSWTSQFAQLMIYLIAGRLSIPLSGDKTLAKMNMETAKEKFAAAISSDANEGITVQETVPDWIDVRGPGYTSGPLGYPNTMPPLFELA